MINSEQLAIVYKQLQMSICRTAALPARTPRVKFPETSIRFALSNASNTCCHTYRASESQHCALKHDNISNQPVLQYTS